MGIITKLICGGRDLSSLLSGNFEEFIVSLEDKGIKKLLNATLESLKNRGIEYQKNGVGKTRYGAKFLLYRRADDRKYS